MGTKITLNHITKIEGHARLNLSVDKGKVKVCELSSTEGARYFEGMVKGRKYFEAHEMTSRICGICSCAHVCAATQAIEDALGIIPSRQTQMLRTLLTLGERIRSHATHLYFLALPDYLGYESAIAMASKYKSQIHCALSMMKVGNMIVKLIGGRDLHPVSVTIGGMLKLPSQQDIDNIVKELKNIKPNARKTCELFSKLKNPRFETDGEYFALKSDEYPTLHGRFASENSSFEKHEYHHFIREYHTDYSNANFVVKDNKRYMVGSLPRLNLNFEKLSKDAKKELKKSKLRLPSKNPFDNNLAQAIELVHSVDEAISICEYLDIRPEPVQDIVPRAGTGVGCIEVPRGTLWHEYTLDAQGNITYANIITPTAQNLLNIQEDIKKFLPRILNLEKAKIVTEIEKLIRNYDPCLSCSAHFLEVNWL